MVQTHQFRLFQVNAHYASVIFRYPREFLICYRDYVTFAMLDDKHTLKLGEPGYPIVAAEHGKQVLVLKQTKFQAGDHDFFKSSFTLRVYLLIDVEESMNCFPINCSPGLH